MSDRLKNLIVEIVNGKQGCKSLELAAEVVIRSKDPDNLDFSTDQIVSAIDDCVKEGRLTEIEYVLSTMDYRAKSFYLPADTKVTVRAAPLAQKEVVKVELSPDADVQIDG
jgi:hypothetical protein